MKTSRPQLSAVDDDAPYTTPEEDPFNIIPLLVQTRQRRSSMLDKWIREQQLNSPVFNNSLDVPKDPTLSQPATCSYPYLAYPELGSGTLKLNAQGSAVSLSSYDLVDDEDIPNPESPDNIIIPHTPQKTSPKSHPKFLNSSPSFRSLHLSFRTSTSTPQSPHSFKAPATATPLRSSFFPLPSKMGSSSSRASKEHGRSSSLGNLNVPGQQTPSFRLSMSPSKWRPSVLGYFGSQVSDPPSDTTSYHPSRPSMSSTNTYTSTTLVGKDHDLVVTSSRVSLVSSVRSQSRLPGNSSSLRSGMGNGPSILSLCEEAPPESPRSGKGSLKSTKSRMPFAPKKTSHLSNSNLDFKEAKEDDSPGRAQQVKARRFSQAEVAFANPKAGARVSLATLGARNQKKKKLIISGIKPGETRKFEGAKRWCESFGEVSQILRMPNGDLHVHFCSPEVADTVCRVRAKVYIAGVGSVNLSWYSGASKR